MPSTTAQDAGNPSLISNTSIATPTTISASSHSATSSGAQLPVPWSKTEDSALIRMMARRFNVDQRGNSLAKDFQDPNYTEVPRADRVKRTQEDIRQRMKTLHREQCTYLIELRNDPKWVRRFGTQDLLWAEEPSVSGDGKDGASVGERSSEGEGGAKQASSERERAVGASEPGAEKSSDVAAKEQQSKESNAEAQPTQQSQAKQGEGSSHAVASQEDGDREEESPAAEEEAEHSVASHTTESSKRKSRKHKRKRGKELTLIIDRIPQRVRLTGQQPDGTAVRYLPNGEVRIEFEQA